MKKKIFTSAKLLLKGVILSYYLVFSAACSALALEFEEKDLSITNLDGKTIPIRVELARSIRELSKGYMGRENIPEGTGMLFIFKKDEKLSFWMKNTPTPLSIAFINSKGEIRETRNMTPFSRQSVNSSEPVRYALEVPQGWFERNNIGKGCIIKLP
ncbi:DUF192 domain-containing protein [Capnocytophaga bilenii]